MHCLLASLALLIVVPLGACNLYFYEDNENEPPCEGDACDTEPDGCYDDYGCNVDETCVSGTCVSNQDECPGVDVDCPPGTVKTCPLNGCEADCTCELPDPVACSTLPESACIERNECTPLYQGVDCICDDQGCTCNDWDFSSCKSECELANTIEAEDATQVERVGPGWAVFSGAVLHEGDGLEASEAGSRLNFNIYGSGLTVHHGIGPNRHEFSVSIDGAPAVVIDTNAPEFDFQVPSVVASGLAPGIHTVRLECLSSICAIDFFTGDSCQ
jgi:hypothetical protein